MKIEIDLNNSLSLRGQMEAVELYIKKYTKSTLQYNCWGEAIRDDKDEIVFDKKPIITQTPKNTGYKIKTSYRNYHVSCHKTKGGTYKFKTWQAV